MKLILISSMLIAGAVWTAIPTANASSAVSIQDIKLVAEKGEAFVRDERFCDHLAVRGRRSRRSDDIAVPNPR